MQLHLVEKTADSITIKFKDPDTTIITPILDRLGMDQDVAIVRYVDTHPELNEPALIVQVRRGNPEDVIKRAADSVAEYFSAINQ